MNQANVEVSRGRRAAWPILLAGASLAAMSMAATPLCAAEVDPGATVEEILVTANKREETVNTVPMSITAASGEALARQGISQPRDLVKITPSFTYTDSYVGSPIYTLRGVGFSDISLGGRPTVSIYTDEAPIPFAIETRGASLDLERVEVLKGPQGTLFGQNATGGAINYIAAKPTRTFEAGATAGVANFNAFSGEAYLSGPLSQTLSARLAVAHESADAWQKSYTTGAGNGETDYTGARASLLWTPSAATRVQLSVSGFVDRSDVQAGQLIGLSPAIPAAAAFIPGLLTYPLAPRNSRAADFTPGLDYGRDNTFVQGNLRFDQDLGRGLTLTSLTSYSRYEEAQLQDIDGTTLVNLSQLTTGDITSISEELRIAGEIGDRGHFVAGLSYAHDKVDQLGLNRTDQATTAFTFVPFGLPLFRSFTDSNAQAVETRGVFVSGDYQITGTAKVYGGLRYTESENDFQGCTADAGDGQTALSFGTLQNIFRAGAGLPANPAIRAGGCITANPAFVPGLVRDSLDEDNVAWRAGAEWTPAERLLLYANVSKGYKAGGFPDLAATVDSQFSAATQESLVAYEAGFKATALDRTLQVNGAVFYYDYTDKQILGKVLDPVFGPLLRLVNVPKSEIKGAELQLAWAPVTGLKVNLGGSYIDSEVLDHFTNFDATGALVDFGGEAFPNTPKWQFVSDIDYRWDIGSRLTAFVGGGVSYRSATNSQLGRLQPLSVKGYALVDLRAGLESSDGVWRVTAWGHNVGDVYYWTAANRNLDTTVRFTGQPATYGVKVSYRFR